MERVVNDCICCSVGRCLLLYDHVVMADNAISCAVQSYVCKKTCKVKSGEARAACVIFG